MHRRQNMLTSTASTSNQQSECIVGKSNENGPKFDAQDPSQTIAWGGRLPSRRRAITGFSSGLAIGKLHSISVAMSTSELIGSNKSLAMILQRCIHRDETETVGTKSR